MREIIYQEHKCTDRGILPDDGKYDVIKTYVAYLLFVFLIYFKAQKNK